MGRYYGLTIGTAERSQSIPRSPRELASKITSTLTPDELQELRAQLDRAWEEGRKSRSGTEVVTGDEDPDTEPETE